MRSVFLIGAAKSGTTAVFSWLARHPEVATHPVKEPNYFSLSGRRGLCHGAELDVNYASRFALTEEAYEAWRNGVRRKSTHRYICDASPSYLYFPGTAAKICAAYPDAKIICILRDPVDRAFSQYMHHVRDGYETVASFDAALAAEEIRIANNWWWGFHYRRAGLYADQWGEYVETFPKASRLVLTYDEVNRQPLEVWSRVCAFLGISTSGPSYLGDRANEASGRAQVPALGVVNTWIRHPSRLRQLAKCVVPEGVRHAVKQHMIAVNSKPAPVLLDRLRRELQNSFLADIARTQSLTGLDLTTWQHPF